MNKIFALLIIFLSFNTNAELRLVTLNYSNHYDNDYDYREVHSGIGIEYKYENNIFGAMNYNNSYNKNSNLLYGGIEEDNGLGATFGIANGYEEFRVISGFTYKLSYFRVLWFPRKITTIGLVLDF